MSVIQIYSLRPDSKRIRNDQRCTKQSDQIFQYHDVKKSSLDNFILTELYIIGTSSLKVLKMQAHYLVLRKA